MGNDKSQLTDILHIGAQIAGAIGGFAVGGPPGAAIGAQLGNTGATALTGPASNKGIGKISNIGNTVASTASSLQGGGNLFGKSALALPSQVTAQTPGAVQLPSGRYGLPMNTSGIAEESGVVQGDIMGKIKSALQGGGNALAALGQISNTFGGGQRQQISPAPMPDLTPPSFPSRQPYDVITFTPQDIRNLLGNRESRFRQTAQRITERTPLGGNLYA